MDLLVSNIQHFSVGDGEGIRTTVFLKGCNLRCPWCHNPETWVCETQVLRYENIGREEICGKKMSIEEIVTDVLSDKAFYEESGGGVTISGGEAMLQADGVTLLASRLQQEGVSVLVDTAGNVPYEAFKKVNAYVDGYLFDYKTDSSEAYEQIIGGDLRRIRENIRRLLHDRKAVRIRIPLIPDFNIEEESIRGMCRDLRELGVHNVDLLPFHRLGIGKYKALGMQYPYEQAESITKEKLEKIKQEFSNYFCTKLEI